MTCRRCREQDPPVIVEYLIEVVTHATETQIKARCPRCGYETKVETG